MKFREVVKGTRAVKVVTFRLANAERPPAPAPGEKPAEDPALISVGLRVLSGAETADSLERAIAAAKAAGAKEWLDTHPLCRLHQMVQTLALACVDPDSRAEPFFASADEILQSELVGTDNIAHLFEQWETWQDECSIETKNLTPEQVIGIILDEATRQEGDAESPLARMRPGLRASFFHTTAVLFANLLTAKSDSTSPDSTDSERTSSSTENGDA